MTERYTLHPIEPLTARRFGLAVLAAGLATAITHVMLPVLAANVFLMFLLAILVSALFGGLWAGLVATVLCCLGAALVAFEPVGTLLMASALDVARLATLGVFGVVISTLSQALLAARTRASLREQEARIGEESFRGLFDSSADPIYVAGALGEVVNVNDAALELHGAERNEILGRPWLSLLDPDLTDVRALREGLERAFAGLPGLYEAWVRHGSGRSVPFEMKVTAARYFGRDVVIAVARDLTDRRRLESQLRQSQKMDAIGRLAGGVAHDFNNLLTSIRGYASLMRDRVSHDRTLLEDLAEIERAVDVATAVTGQLLAFSRKQEYLPRAISLNDSLDRSELLLRRLLDERVELVVEREPSLGLSLLDEGQFEQIVMNLVVNARDAIHGTGRIVVRTWNASAGSPPSPHVAISVSDTGVGMDDELRAHIFEPFFTTKETGHGTGLGLSTVYGIVQQSGGRVDVVSAPGRGSTFTVYLPRVDGVASPPAAAAAPFVEPPAATAAPVASAPVMAPPAAAAEAAAALPPAAPKPQPAGLTILLAEDEAPVRHLVRRVLARGGYQVIEAANGREALDMAHAHTGPIDALVTDVIMPELTGPELAEALRADAPDLPVLFTSGYNDQGMEGDGVVSGLGIAFLQKPFLPDDLLRMLGELVAESTGPEDGRAA